MPTAKKEATIEELRGKIASAKNLFFTNYTGLTVGDITKYVVSKAECRVIVTAPAARDLASAVSAHADETSAPIV